MKYLTKLFVKKNQDITQLDFCGKTKRLNYLTIDKLQFQGWKRWKTSLEKSQNLVSNISELLEVIWKNGYATKLNTKLHNENKEIVDYIPYHGLKMKTSWKNLLKWPGYLSKLISILIKFWREKFADMKKMYHHIFVSLKDRDALRLVWRKFSAGSIEDYRMSVHIFGKTDSPCISNWVVKKAKD